MKIKIIRDIFLFGILFLLLVLSSDAAGQVDFGRITRIDGNDVFINLGSDDGLLVGMQFDVFRLTDVKHPSTGVKIYSEREVIGSFKLTQVFPAYSQGKILYKSETFEPGDYIELVLDVSPSSMEPTSASGLITDVRGGVISFNMGSSDGVEVGLLFDIFRKVDKRHPDTDIPLGESKVRIGQIAAVSVQDEESVGRIVEGSDIAIGDLVELAMEQEADRTFSIKDQTVFEKTVPVKTSSSSLSTDTDENAILAYVESSKGEKITFSIPEGVNTGRISSGTIASVYRKERLIHPITGAEIASPIVEIAQIQITGVKGRSGSGKILKRDASLQKGDWICQADELSAFQISTSDVVSRMPSRRAGDLKREAQDLTYEIIQIQRDINTLRGMVTRIDRIEKDIAAQKSTTRRLANDIADIKKSIQQAGSEAFISGRSESEIFDLHPDKARSLSFVYTDETGIEFEHQGKKYVVSVDGDSLRLAFVERESGIKTAVEPEGESSEIYETEKGKPREPQVLKDKESQMGTVKSMDDIDTEGVEDATEQSFLGANWKFIAGVVGGLALIVIGLLMFLKKKEGGKPKAKKSVVADEEGEFEEEAGEEGEEEEEFEEVEEGEEEDDFA